MTSSMTALRPPPTLQPPTPTPTQKTTSTAGYRRARVVVRSAWPRPVPWPLGVVTAPDRPDDLAGTVKVVRYAEPTAHRPRRDQVDPGHRRHHHRPGHRSRVTLGPAPAPGGRVPGARPPALRRKQPWQRESPPDPSLRH